MTWEYRIHRFARKGILAKDQLASQQVLDDYGRLGWELVSISDLEALAVFKRRTVAREADLDSARSTIAAELKELTEAIEELNR